MVFHLLPNAHLDPVWLWDWREGLNEGLNTVRTILDLMDEFPELTFMRGEAAIYQQIEKADPGTFKRVLQQIEQGRWDVVGGTVIQPDSNLASTEVLCREFERGLDYFKNHLGVRPRIAWQADSFGHSAGLPNLFAAFGMEGFSFTRPGRFQFKLESPAFWWEGDFGNKVLCYRQHWGWYGVERDNFHEVLDQTLIGASKLSFQNVGIQFGLGNHGGGPTRRHIQELNAWRELHPEVEVKFSTLHGCFDALRQEIGGELERLPTVRGEFGFCLRGCNSAVQRFKSLYRKSEALVSEAESTRSVIGAATGVPVRDLSEAWDALTFNAFHDILPGTSIERAFDDQTAWVGIAWHRAQQARFDALNALAVRVDTTVPPPPDGDHPTDVPFLVWNSLPYPFAGLVELEAGIDYRPLWPYRGVPDQVPLVVFGSDGEPLAFQSIPTEHRAMPELAWRKRVLVPLEIPPLGWTSVRLGWRKETQTQARVGEGRADAGESPQIANREWTIGVEGGVLRIERQGRNFFPGDRGLELRTMEDPWGSWGGMAEERDSYCLETIRETWRLSASRVLESGPLRASLWTRWQAGNSWLDLTFKVEDGLPFLQIAARLLWNERSARLKLVLPCTGRVEYDVPASRIQRAVEGQVSACRWVTRTDGQTEMGFASDVLSDFDASPDELRVTLARAVTGYATDIVAGPEDFPWIPAVDCGELKANLCLFGDAALGDKAGDHLLYPPVALIIPPTPGEWPRHSSLGHVHPESTRVLTLDQPGPRQLRVRVQNRATTAEATVFTLGKSRLDFGTLGPQQIKSFDLTQDDAGDWQLAPAAPPE